MSRIVFAAMGIRVTSGHAAAAVGQADVVVVSSAVKAGNPEVLEATQRQIPVIPGQRCSGN